MYYIFIGEDIPFPLKEKSEQKDDGLI